MRATVVLILCAVVLMIEAQMHARGNEGRKGSEQDEEARRKEKEEEARRRREQERDERRRREAARRMEILTARREQLQRQIEIENRRILEEYQRKLEGKGRKDK